MFTSYFVVCFLSIVTCSKAEDVLNEDSLKFIRCSVWDHECQKQTVQMIIPLLAEGLPDLGTRRLDPLREPFLEILYRGSRKELRHFELCGFANSIVNKASFDISSKILRLRFTIPVLTMNATYEASGFMHEIPFNGKGDMYIRANDAEVDAVISFDVREDNKNRKFAEVTNYFYSLEVLGDAEINFENVNADDPRMAAAVRNALKQYWKALIAEEGKLYFNPFAEAAIKALTQFLHALDLETFFTDI